MEQSDPSLAETIVIKSIFTNSANLVNVTSQLETRDFAYKPYRILYIAIKQLAASHTIINGDSVMALLQSKAPQHYSEIAQMGGATWCDSHYDDAYSAPVSLDEHIHTIRSAADNKALLDATNKLKVSVEQGTSSDDAINEFERALQSIRLRGKQSDIEPIGNGIQQLLQRIVSRDDDLIGIDISRKFPRINAMLKRIQPRRVTVFLSSFKSGKSTLLLELAWYLAHECGMSTLYTDSENIDSEVQTRLLAKLTGFTMDYILSGEWNNVDEHRNMLNNAAQIIADTPLMWKNVNHMSRGQIVSLVKLSQLKHGTRVFVYDYIKPDMENAEGRVDLQVGAKVDMLKEDIAKACNVAVLSAVQMNNNTGRVSNSAEVERLADNVVTLRPVTVEDDMPFATHILKLKTSRYTTADVVVPLNVDFGKQDISEI